MTSIRQRTFCSTNSSNSAHVCGRDVEKFCGSSSVLPKTSEGTERCNASQGPRSWSFSSSQASQRLFRFSSDSERERTAGSAIWGSRCDKVQVGKQSATRRRNCRQPFACKTHSLSSQSVVQQLSQYDGVPQLTSFERYLWRLIDCEEAEETEGGNFYSTNYSGGRTQR